MRIARPSALLFSALLAAAGSAQAQKMKPGLWEHSTAVQGAGGEMAGAMAGMQEQMARMKPEERQMVEQMMAQRGMSVGGAGGGPGSTMRVCITADQAARDEVPLAERQCKRTSMNRSGNTVRFAFTCEGEHPSSGEGQFTFVSPTEHRGTVRVTTTGGKGRPETMEVQTSAKWLGADCGSVQPRP